MKNPFTVKIESYMGAIFIVAFSAFFVGLMIIAVNNFSSEVDIMNSQQVKVRGVSETEYVLIRDWVKDNNIQVPEGKGARYIISKYPSRPWLTGSYVN